MHHAGMDMDHGHMGHGDMDMGGKCNMNVINTINMDISSLYIQSLANVRCSLDAVYLVH